MEFSSATTCQRALSSANLEETLQMGLPVNPFKSMEDISTRHTIANFGRWHSCNPNAKFVGALLFLTDAVGESEITIDYRSTETAFQEAFFCRCPTCMKEKRKVKIGHTA
jgi:hypothetical protein